MSDEKRPGAGGPARSARQSGMGSPEPPYGTAIHDAVASDDLQYMKAIAEAARRALHPVEFSSATADNATEIREALTTLEAAIARLEPRAD